MKLLQTVGQGVKNILKLLTISCIVFFGAVFLTNHIIKPSYSQSIQSAIRSIPVSDTAQNATGKNDFFLIILINECHRNLAIEKIEISGDNYSVSIVSRAEYPDPDKYEMTLMFYNEYEMMHPDMIKEAELNHDCKNT